MKRQHNRREHGIVGEIDRMPRSGEASISSPWRILREEIVQCRACPRLVQYREEIGDIRKRAFRDETYWSRPLPGFGDRNAQVVVIGLAPAAHGGNRTGRVFTGDRSADYLLRAMWQNGFANQPTSTHKDDGLRLNNAFLTLPVRCAPPDNKPTRQEFENCNSFFWRELALLYQAKVVIALGSIALNAYLDGLKLRGMIRSRAAFPFAHGAFYRIAGSAPVILTSYHPSQQNTFTGRLTLEMLSDVFAEARRVVERGIVERG